MYLEEWKFFCIITVGFSSQRFPKASCCHFEYQSRRKGLLSGASHFIWSEKSDYNSPLKLVFEEAALNSQQAETVNFLNMKNSSQVPIMLCDIYKE